MSLSCPPAPARPRASLVPLALLLLAGAPAARGALAAGGPLPQASAAAPDAPALAPARVRERLEAALGAWIAERGLPGASLACVLPGGETVALAAGVASQDEPGALAPEGRMLTGSVGKTFVAAAALRLAARGELDLDERAWTFLGDVEGFERLANARDFTLRQCLRHQSGLRRYEFEPAFAQALVADPERRWTPMELCAFVFDDEPLFAPGAGWSYADTNYVVVGMVLERVTGEPFYEHVRRAFLEPLDLQGTLPSDRRDVPGMVQGHVVLGRSFGVGPRALERGVFTYNPQFEWCGGGWAQTPRDLARWARALFSGAALPEGALAPMLADAADASALGPGLRYGLGVLLWDTALGPARGHTGFMLGYQAACAWFPERSLAIALELNTDDTRASGRLEPVLERLAQVALGE